LMTTNPFLYKDVLSVTQFSREDLDYLFDLARTMRRLVSHAGGVDLLRGYVLAAIFYEPSTRTSSSFLTAMQRLGGGIIPITEVKASSVAKGETLGDTIRTLDQYADVIVIRHPQPGSAQVAAESAASPVINAGDGAGEHPTQALLDVFTILEELGHIDGLKVALLGDLKYGRTVHSLSRLLALYEVELTFVSPDILPMPPEIVADLKAKGISARETADLEEAIAAADVLYVTRVQKERFADPAQYEAVRGSYTITPELLKRAKEEMVVMHPLPRVGEIDPATDSDPRAAYFRQVKNGVYVRMALLAAVLGSA
jgi:aspartate carbamoyltransferase catalytic subunit